MIEQTSDQKPLAQRLLSCLKHHGAKAIFGIPGDYALPLFRELEASNNIPLVTLSHEPSLGFAADAAARFTGGIGVAMATYGAGALNLLNAVAGAYAERSPLVVISAAPALSERGSNFGLHHQSRALDSQLRIFSEVTCAQGVIDDPRTAPHLIAHTISECVRRSLPVYLEIPADIAAQSIGPLPVVKARKPDPDAVAACAAEIAERVRQARNPVLMIGIEVRRYGLESQVSRLAHRVNMPVVSSLLGRGVAAAGPAPIAGTYLGLAGDPEISRRVEESDTLILLGVVLSDTDFGVPAKRLDLRRAIHASEGQVRIGHHIYPDIPLADLIEELTKHAVGNPRIRDSMVTAAQNPPPPHSPDAAALQPSDVSTAINHFFTAHGKRPLVTDIGDCLFISLEVECQDLIAQSYYASMGFGVPAALGIQAASGVRPLVLVGDGAFQMTGWELGNCQRYGWDPIVLVLNNQSWEMLRTFEPTARFNDLSDWHFADIAAPLGGMGTRVHTQSELREALEAANKSRGRFHIIEIMLNRGKVSNALQRFVQATKQRRQRNSTNPG